MADYMKVMVALDDAVDTCFYFEDQWVKTVVDDYNNLWVYTRDRSLPLEWKEAFTAAKGHWRWFKYE